jgi:uncharacterized repeat protein (TIGR01451 family)
LGSIKVCKVIVDPNGNITDGSVLSGDTFTINWDNHLDPTVFTAGTTPNEKIFSSSEGNDAYCITYDNLNVETYHYSQEVLSDSSAWATPKYNDQYSSHVYDLGDFYQYSSHNDNSNGEINLELVGPNRTLIVLNQYIARNPKLVLTKSNDKPSGVVPSENVTYTLSLQNTGDVDLGDIIVTDAPAGGFTYVNGSTLIDGVNTSDPSISGGQLSWTIPSLAVGGTVTIVYQLTTPSDLAAGTYTNFATCTTGRGQGDNITQFTTAPVIGRFSASCDPVTSTVAMGQSSNYGGNLNTTSRVLGISTVLGASTELPGTGSPTVLLLISLGALGAGLFLRIYDVKITKKSVKKVVKSAKKKGKKHAKK